MDTSKADRKIDIRKLEKMAFILKTIAHPLRIGIVELLAKHEKLCVNDICQKLDSEQSLTSHHLSNMRLKGILDCSRSGKHMYYSLKMKEVTEALNCMNRCAVI